MPGTLDKYEKPSVTADIITFRLRNAAPDDYRRNARPRLSLLLVRRGIEPFGGLWALPGGFLRRGETVEECAARELREETGVEPRVIEPIGVFSRSDRDPRGWVLSNAFLVILPGDRDAAAVGGSDAAEAAWFDVEAVRSPPDIVELCFRSGLTAFTAILREGGARYGRTVYETTDRGSLAFDHAEIIAAALDVLRERVTRFDAVFDFLPERFTLTAVQNAQEAILQKSVAPANFRRKITDYVEETDAYETGSGHRPARLFIRKQNREV